MFDRLVSQATAFGLAAVLTAAMLAGVNGLATQEHAAASLATAADATPVQVVVVTAPRLRS